MPKRFLAHNVYDAAIARLLHLYEGPYYPVISFSAGKDSGVCVELAIEAARMAGRLPVQVSMRDEEILLPGSFEYAERMAARPEVEFSWWVAGQPIVNVYNRAEPYFWVFDDRLHPDEWMRQPPPFAKKLNTLVIQGVVSRESYPQAPADQQLVAVTGVRASESPNRLMSTFSMGGWLTKDFGRGETRTAKPIYDWRDEDIWLAISKFGWDYNRAYDTMHRHGVSKSALRIAPPTMSTAGAFHLQVASRAWPQWFDRLCDRCPGVRQVALFGKRACQPTRRYGETWEQTFRRECVAEAPDWIAERATKVMEATLAAHARHTTMPFPEVKNCSKCGQVACWRGFALDLYNGDPFSTKGWSYGGIKDKYVEPEFFRPGAGTWGKGNPAF